MPGAFLVAAERYDPIDFGIDYVQGYGIVMPVPFEELPGLPAEASAGKHSSG